MDPSTDQELHPSEIEENKPDKETFELEEDKPSDRGMISRFFGKIEEGAMRTAIFTLVNTAVGAGMLALSKAVASYGYIPGILMLFGGAANLYLGLYSFRYLMFKYPDAKIYSDLVREILGVVSLKEMGKAS